MDLYINATDAAVYFGGWDAPFWGCAPVCAIEGECVSLLDVLSIAREYGQIMNMTQTVCELAGLSALPTVSFSGETLQTLSVVDMQGVL